MDIESKYKPSMESSLQLSVPLCVVGVVAWFRCNPLPLARDMREPSRNASGECLSLPWGSWAFWFAPGHGDGRLSLLLPLD